jgi:ATP-dependent RNA helicase DeaD
MLDLGFREDLEAILGYAPEGHRTHLISATFPRGVKALADKVQVDPAHVEGTPLGAANADIDHVVHLVDPYQRVDAIINLLLACPDQQTLVFARTRADVARVARELHGAGFAVSSISGEMEQPERNRALADFKRGKLRVLVATDVAARGIDVQDIARVIHAEPPDDPDSYTHRSGRTGRAGRKGQSAVLCSPSALSKTSLLLKRARVQFRIESIPTGADILQSRDERLCGDLLAEDPEGFAGHDDRLWACAKRLAADTGRVTRTIARLLERSDYGGPTEPREVRNFAKPKEGALLDRRPRSNYDRPNDFRANDRGRPSSRPAPRVEHGRPERPFPRSEHTDASRSEPTSGPRNATRPGAEAGEGRQERRPPLGPTSDTPRGRREHGPSDASAPSNGGFVPFRVSWGGEQGADPRRLLAMVCRRGEVRGSDVGNIRVARGFSTVEIAASVADAFAETVAKPDPRNPRVFIKRDAGRAHPREVAANG